MRERRVCENTGRGVGERGGVGRAGGGFYLVREHVDGHGGVEDERVRRSDHYVVPEHSKREAAAVRLVRAAARRQRAQVRL